MNSKVSKPEVVEEDDTPVDMPSSLSPSTTISTPISTRGAEKNTLRRKVTIMPKSESFTQPHASSSDKTERNKKPPGTELQAAAETSLTTGSKNEPVSQLEVKEGTEPNKEFKCPYCSYKSKWKGNVTKHTSSCKEFQKVRQREQEEYKQQCEKQICELQAEVASLKEQLIKMATKFCEKTTSL